MTKTIRDKADMLNQCWFALNTYYEEYAKSAGFTYSSLNVFCVIYKTENCIQKMICEQTLLPKQTVNNIITAFYKQGYVYLRELPQDRRTKSVHLTEKGQQKAEEVLKVVSETEEKAIGQFTEEESDELLRLLSEYVKCCDKNMPR